MAISSTSTTTYPNESHIPRGPVTATLNFYSAPLDGSPPHNNIDPTPESGLPLRNYGIDPREVLIRDARGAEPSSSFTLDKDAFQILANLPPSAEKDFADDASIAKNYYPEVENLLLDVVPGATKVVIFDHTIRRSDPDAPRAPVQRVHIDQTASSAAQRVRRHVASESEAEKILAEQRYRIINVWRPLNKLPVESSPLAFASSSTLPEEDIVPVEHRYPSGYTGQTAAIRWSEGQEWWYLSGMTGDERILLECFDSEALKEGTKVKGGRVAHTAFADPRTREEAEGRESIEVRCLVFGP